MSDPVLFVTRRKGDNKWSRKVHGPKAMGRIRSLVGSKDPIGQDCRIGKSETQDSHPTKWSSPILSRTLLARSEVWFDSAEGAEILHVEVSGEEIQVRAILTKSYKVGVDVDPNIASVWEFIRKRVPFAVSWGISSCRAIGTTGTWSSHAWLKGIDIAGPRLVLALVARLAVRFHGKYKLEVIIYRGRIWTPGAGWHAYTGSCPHEKHVHINVAYPSGKPPCA